MTYFQSINVKGAHRLALILLACLCISRSEATPAPPPNIVLILADDLGYGDVGVYGAELIKTPNLDALAAGGVRLSQFYTSGNVCTPSRAGLMTGRYPIRSGLADKTVAIGDARGLKQTEDTLSKRLKSLGYTTGLIGKWHLGDKPHYHPNAHGFDTFFGLLYSNDEPEQALYKNKDKVEDPIDAQMLAVKFTEESVKFIEQNTSRPFFLFFSMTSPHKPLLPSPEFIGHSEAGAYGDVVEELDWSVGQVISTLERHDLLDNTLIIFTSDNGPFPEGSSGGLRGGKGTSWDGGYRVPLIAHWLGKIEPNSTSSAMSMNIDLMPTLLGVAGADDISPTHFDGKNIWPLMTGSDQSPHDVLYFFSDEQIAAVRTPKWKTVLRARYLGIKRWLPEHDVRLLFDMENDPFERYSQAAHHEEVWTQMMEHWEQGVSELETLATSESN